MIQALHTAASGLKGQQNAIDVIANNVANINTTGYKTERVNFKDAMYVAMVNPDNAQSGVNLQQGTGVLTDSISKIFTVGNIFETGSSLDVALLDDNAFFKVEDANGNMNFTRDGNFHLSAEQDGNYLVTSTGEYVLDNNDNKIQINDTNVSLVSVNESGEIYNSNNQLSGNIGIVSFNNPDGLEKLSGNKFAQTNASGEASALKTNNVKHKYLESSNVDFADEITNLIKAQRAYQIASKVLSTADEMEEKANNLRR